MLNQLGMVPGHTQRVAMLCSCTWLQMYLFSHFFLMASCIEMYNEKVNDLLVKGKTGLKLCDVEGTT